MQITTNQQVVFTRPQQAVYSNDENGVVIIQQSPAAMTTLPQGYTMPGQLSTMYIPPQVIMLKNANFYSKSVEIV